MRRRGQLFLIEVIVALTVLIVLVSTLFTIQTFTPTSSDTNLLERGENIIDTLVESGQLYEYLEDANFSRYVLQEPIFDSQNQTKIEVFNTIKSGIPIIASFKAFTDRYNDTLSSWQQIDIVNFEATLPTGSDVVSIEHYTPGFDGVYDEYRFQLFIWVEVNA